MANNKVKAPLKLKYSIMLILLIMLLLVGSFSVSFNLILNINQKVFSENFINETRTLVEYFSETIFDGIKLDDDLVIAQTMAKVTKMQNINYAILFDKNKKIMLHSEPYSKQKFLEQNNRKLKALFKKKGLVIYPKFKPEKIESTYLISRTFYDKRGNFYGMLLVKYTSNKLQQLLSDMSGSLNKIRIVAIIISMLIAALFAILMASITVNPINTMIKGTEIIGAGDLDYVIPIKRNDELGLLADYLNDMTGKIKDAKDTEIEQKKQDEQLAIANQIQNSLYPEKSIVNDNCQIGGFSFAAKGIGGDYYFFKDIAENLTFFILADVSGKGVPAALVTFMIATVVNTIVNNTKKEHDAGTIMTEANHILAEEMTKMGRFATGMFFLYDKKNKNLNFISAGHGELHVYREATNEFEIIDNNNLPLAIADDTPYTSMDFKVQKGDIITVFSDGINEARNEKKEEYGFEPFFEALKKNKNTNVDELLKYYETELKDFMGDAEQHDDMTLLIFKQMS